MYTCFMTQISAEIRLSNELTVEIKYRHVTIQLELEKQ